jgi:hypothetical protein
MSGRTLLGFVDLLALRLLDRAWLHSPGSMGRDAPPIVRTNIRSALIVDIPSQERLPQALSKAIILPHLLDEPISIVGGKKGLR